MKILTIVLELIFLAGFIAQAIGIATLYGWQQALLVCGSELILISLAGAYYLVTR
jgi:hypothetical protein